MRITPLTSLMLSVMLGGAALLGARYVLQPSEADAAAIVADPQAVEPELVPVVIARRDIPRGAVISDAVAKLDDWPDSEVPAEGFSTLEDFSVDPHTARRALRPISAGEPILDPDLSAPGVRPSLSARLRPGYRAVTVETDQIRGVGGFVLPGDFVDILLTKDIQTETVHKVASAEVLLQNVEVLAIDQNDDPTAEKPENAKHLTLAVALPDAQRLMLAREMGALSFVLRGVGDPGEHRLGKVVDRSGIQQPDRRDDGPPVPEGYKEIIVHSGDQTAPTVVPRSLP